ncbi:hypothetical protein [Nocardioides sp. SR21]|uniref:hypothetical protein n=1 Tax=Nocardioides sp. SR21 TaxID=2919501 RepID=UPI001FA94603|nr:hypothetical protein [Nocardioides sp. SR21]
MLQDQSIARRCVAVVATAALALGASTLSPGVAQAAKPLKGGVSKTVPLTCTIFDDEFEYDATIKLKGVRAKKSDPKVTLRATMSDLPGVSPVPIDNDVEATLKLKVGSTKATLKGKGHATAGATEPVGVPPVKGSVKNRKNSLPVSVTSMSVHIPDYALTITCVPTGSGAMGTLKLK